MNLYILNQLPIVAARWHHDEHVRDLPIEVSHLLLAAYLDRDPDGFDWGVVGAVRRRAAERLDACGVWRAFVGRSAATYHWVWQYGKALVTEYRYRFGSESPASDAIDCLEFPPRTIASDRRWYTWPIAVPKRYVRIAGHRVHHLSELVFMAYQLYYFNEKTVGATWTSRSAPPFVLNLRRSNR